MRLPGVAITAIFTCGIAFGLHPAVGHHVSSLTRLWFSVSLAVVLISAGFIFAKLGRLFPAAAASLLSWIVLGFLGACMAQERLALETPLRWHGRLRDEPKRLPWGYGYEIELSGVEFKGASLHVLGGLRLGFSPCPEGTPTPEVHAGDEGGVLTEARRPQVFKDEGAFERRVYLAQQNIDLIATLRAPELLERISSPAPTAGIRLAQARRRLRDEIDKLFAQTPQVGGVLRAMLLGDRSLLEQTEAANFQKTGVFHVLVVAGLHVGALAIALYWVGRKLRLSPVWTALFTLTLLFTYVAVVEQRPPVLRAAMMASIVVLGGFYFRRLDLLNSAAVAALILLVAKPLALRDSSFQL